MTQAKRLAFVAVALLATTVALASLALPWSRGRDCPLFEECGAWHTDNGFVVAPQVMWSLLAGILLFASLWRSQLFARIAGLLSCAVAGLSLMLAHEWGDFAIFADVEFPLRGFYVCSWAVGAAAAAWVAAFVQEVRAQDKAAPAPAA